MSLEVAEARTALARVVSTELPKLEQAIAARDFDLALAQASIVRGARLQVRNLLGGGDLAGALRADWAKVEPRIDAALIKSPRPSADRDTAQQQWTARLARGTGSPAAPRAASGTATGKPNRGRPRTGPALEAVANAIEVEVYYAPSSGGAGASGTKAQRDAQRDTRRDLTADVSEESTRRVPRKRTPSNGR